MSRVVIFDIETDGLLDQVTKLHVLCARVIADGVKEPVLTFRADRAGEAMELLSSADVLVGHNIVSFDIPALEKLYPDWVLPEGVTIRDTMVMARMCFANVKDGDFRLHEKGMIEGKYIGQHGLEAWGQRLGVWKGDYKHVMEARAAEQGLTDKEDIRKFVWGSWNQEIEDYCVQDVEVTTALWDKIEEKHWSPVATRLEHRIHHVMSLQEQFGFAFDVEAAQKLAAEVRVDFDKLHKETVDHFGRWVAPKKLYKGDPRPDFGEDDSRKKWAEITVPKKKIRYSDPKRGEVSPDAPYCAVHMKEFNPNSRPQIIDRLQTVYQWEPVDFTENGNAVVDDDVLRNLAPHIPICENLAELFFLTKLLGALENGKNAWLGLVKNDGRLHGYVNTGGTVSGRASHLSPNKAQVPKVSVVDVLNKDGEAVAKAGGVLLPEHFNKKVLGADGKPIADCFTEEGIRKKKVILKGRKGKYGWECRSLFTAPPGWWLMGCDLSGIELRCLAARLAEFDGGEYVRVVLDGDPHSKNQVAFQLESRDNAKTCLYAIMYGGGDLKVGSIVLPPSASAGQMRSRGKQLKANLQSGIPAFGKLIKKITKQAARGSLEGLDGRKLYVRSKHSALNLQLQSDAALIAKLWVVYFFDMMNEHYVFGEDWGMCAWVHDEVQAACRTKEIADHAAELCKEAAKLAGEFFEYAAPVAAESKVGRTWAMTH